MTPNWNSMELTGLSSRRTAAGSLPAFSLPPPNSDVPRASDSLSPGLASVQTTSSQGSQAPAHAHAQPSNMQYTYAGTVHTSWPGPANSSYSVSSSSQPPQPLSHSAYGPRSSMYAQAPAMGYAQRNSPSPSTGGDGLPPPSYDGVHQSFASSSHGGGSGGAGGGGGPESHHHHQHHHHNHHHHPQHHMSSAQATSHASAILAHASTQPPASSIPAPVDPYTHSRPPSAPSYFAASTTSQQPAFPSYAPPSHPSPASTGPSSRGMVSLAGQHPLPTMAPHPGSYRPQPYSYPSMPSINGPGPVMSNIHQPGAQLSVIPGGLGMASTYGGHQFVYGHHGQPQQQPERPFKCDQCTQSFSRNHDLKRHKKIHLAVKPYPCSYCSKSFSRKDALKRHRLVKGCESKSNEHAAAEGVGADRPGDAEDDRLSMGKEV